MRTAMGTPMNTLTEMQHTPTNNHIPTAKITLTHTAPISYKSSLTLTHTHMSTVMSTRMATLSTHIPTVIPTLTLTHMWTLLTATMGTRRQSMPIRFVFMIGIQNY